MAGATTILNEAETRARWAAFAWTDENATKSKVIVGRYPPGRQHSAIIPLLDLARSKAQCYIGSLKERLRG